MPTEPLVSVIIPVYNGAAVLTRCLESLKAQTYDRVEILVVDDGSTDNSTACVQPPVRLLSTGGRKGAGAARNLGANEAKGEVLAFTDCDVVAPPDWVARAVRQLREREVDAVGGSYAGPVKQTCIQRFAYEELAWRRRHFKGEVRTMVSNNLFCKKDAFHAVGGFPERYRAASSEDMEFSWRLSGRYRIWWDEDNGVYHDFADTLDRYLRQQMRFARDAVPMLLGRHRELMTAETHHGKQLYVEVFLTGLAGGLAVIGQGGLALCALAAMVLTNGGFLLRLVCRQGMGFAVQALVMVLLRNLWIIAGCFQGAINSLQRQEDK